MSDVRTINRLSRDIDKDFKKLDHLDKARITLESISNELERSLNYGGIDTAASNIMVTTITSLGYNVSTEMFPTGARTVISLEKVEKESKSLLQSAKDFLKKIWDKIVHFARMVFNAAYREYNRTKSEFEKYIKDKGHWTSNRDDVSFKGKSNLIYFNGKTANAIATPHELMNMAIDAGSDLLFTRITKITKRFEEILKELFNKAKESATELAKQFSTFITELFKSDRDEDFKTSIMRFIRQADSNGNFNSMKVLLDNPTKYVTSVFGCKYGGKLFGLGIEDDPNSKLGLPKLKVAEMDIKGEGDSDKSDDIKAVQLDSKQCERILIQVGKVVEMLSDNKASALRRSVEGYIAKRRIDKKYVKPARELNNKHNDQVRGYAKMVGVDTLPDKDKVNEVLTYVQNLLDEFIKNMSKFYRHNMASYTKACIASCRYISASMPNKGIVVDGKDDDTKDTESKDDKSDDKKEDKE